jgi:hypothetical protein
MGFTSLTEVTKTAGAYRGGRQKRAPDTALVSIVKSPNGKTASHALSFTLYPGVAKKARLVEGDRVDILFDAADGLCLIRRNNQGAWTLSANNRKKGQRSNSLRLQATLRRGMPYFMFDDSMSATEAEWDIDDDDGGLLIQLPRHPKANGGPAGW